jgi:uncharacterized membrane protein
MSELTVVGFKGTHRASEVLSQVQELDADWAIDLKDAVAVYRTKNGKLRVDDSVQMTSKQGAAGGGLIGSMIGALLAIPLTGGASAAVAATAVGATALTFGTTGAVIGGLDAADWKDTYGISEDFVKQVGGMVQPGNSALFVLAKIRYPEEVAKRFQGYGGTVLRTTLPPEKAQRLQREIAAR